MAASKSLLAFACAAALCACGGGEPLTADQLIAAAQDAERRALALVTAACAADAECGELRFASSCGTSSHALSLVAPTSAQALALAGEQRRLYALYAETLPAIPHGCPPPTAMRPACVASACVMRAQ